MAKFYLDTEIEFNFSLFGVNTISGDYRLCWHLNKTLNLDLRKELKPIVIPDDQHQMNTRFYYHKCYDNDAQATYLLLSNKSGSVFLVPEHKKADFVLMVEHSAVLDPIKILKKIQNLKQVLMAFPINPDGLKSKNNLLLAT